MISKTYESISKREFYYKFFELYNVLQNNHKLKLTDRQIDFLAEFMSLDNSYKFTRFKNLGKKQVISNYKEKGEDISVQNLDATLHALKKKAVLIEQTDGVKYLNPKIEKFIDSDSRSFEFIFKFNNIV